MDTTNIEGLKQEEKREKERERVKVGELGYKKEKQAS
uniref:Uncharacterized protein n=1 Tax=Amphimedon queenslandica TaxID=400682 RepID=A0A1X7VC16_AMPQE